MSRRRWRTAGVVAAIGLLQAGAVLLYRSTADERASASVLQGERPPSARLPALDLEDAAGAPVTLAPGRPRLVHFWATWCHPCRQELPGLLSLGEQLARADGVELAAVSLDADWPTIVAFFGGRVPSATLRARAADAMRAHGVSMLPETWLVSASGEVLVRYAGTRDWTASGVQAELRREVERAE